MKEEPEFTVKSRPDEVASTATISERIPVSGKGIFSSFIKVGLEEPKRKCSSPHSGREAPGSAGAASPAEDFHASQPAVQPDGGCAQLVRIYKGGFSFKSSDAFSDKNFLRC